MNRNASTLPGDKYISTRAEEKTLSTADRRRILSNELRVGGESKRRTLIYQGEMA